MHSTFVCLSGLTVPPLDSYSPTTALLNWGSFASLSVGWQCDQACNLQFQPETPQGMQRDVAGSKIKFNLNASSVERHTLQVSVFVCSLLVILSWHVCLSQCIGETVGNQSYLYLFAKSCYACTSNNNAHAPDTLWECVSLSLSIYICHSIGVLFDVWNNPLHCLRVPLQSPYLSYLVEVAPLLVFVFARNLNVNIK